MLLTVVLTNSPTCFVNLPPKIVNAILDQASSAPTAVLSLVLQLSWMDPSSSQARRCIVGWAGEASLDDQVIEVPAEFAACLQLHHNQQVDVKILEQVPNATQVHVEPASPDDWEIVELNQGYLEEQILNQINVVYEGQVFPLWIRQQTLVHFRIVSTAPGPFVRLVRDAEVVIAPKLRPSHQTNGTSETVFTPASTKKVKKVRLWRLRVLDLDPSKLKHRDLSPAIPLEHCAIVHMADLEYFGWKEGETVAFEGLRPRNKSVKYGMMARGSGGGGGNTRSNGDKLTSDILSSMHQQQPSRVYLKVFGSKRIVAQGHVAIHHTARNSLGLKLLKKAKLFPIRFPPPLKFRSLQLKRVHWEDSQTQIAKNAFPTLRSSSEVKKAFNEWMVNAILATRSEYDSTPSGVALPSFLDANKDIPSIALTNGSVITLSFHNPEKTKSVAPLKEDYAVFFDVKEEEQQAASSDNTKNRNGSVQAEQEGRRAMEGLRVLQLTEAALESLWVWESKAFSFEVSIAAVPITYQMAPPLYQGSVSVGMLGGLSKQIEELRSWMTTRLKFSLLQTHLAASAPKGLIVVHGAHGCGKSALVSAVAQEFTNDPHCFAYPIYIPCAELSGVRTESVRSKWKSAFGEAVKNAPSVIILDDLDVLVPAEQEEMNSMDVRGRQLAECLSQLIAHLDANERGARNKSVLPNRVCLLATAKSVTSLHPLIQSVSVLSTAIEIPPPNSQAREEILRRVIQHKAIQYNESKLDLGEVTAETEGCYGADLLALVERAVHAASIRYLRHLSDARHRSSKTSARFELVQEDFDEAHKGFTPSSLKGVKLHKSEVSWADIGGLNTVKDTLKETLEWPSKFSDLFASCPLRLRAGLLLYGPPGCGKTLLASAVAKECGLNFISIKGPELLNKYIGATEQAVRDLFGRASAAKPCVLFFDEFDSIAPRRGHDSTGVTDRVVNQLLTQLDGVEGMEGIYVLAATSRPDLIDPALLRPGRLDKSLFCNIPTAVERLDILKAISKSLNQAEDVRLNELAEWTEYYTGADLQALMYSAQLEAIHGVLHTSPPSSPPEVTPKKKDKGKDKVKVDEEAAVVKEEEDASKKISVAPPQQKQPRQEFAVIQMNDASKLSQTDQEKVKLTQQIENIYQRIIGANNEKESTKQQKEGPVVTMQHIINAFEKSAPSVSLTERRRYEAIYANFVESRGGTFGLSEPQGTRQTLA
ncbi:Peroxisome biosynthesis protein pex1 [Balamuthia mandrillaris]